MGQNSKTRAWELYEKGRQYNNSLVPNQYRLVNTNIEFFAGNQWINVPMTPAMSRLPKPVFNIIKRVASLFVASLTSSGTTIHFEPLSYYDGENQKDPENNAAEYATAEVENLLEKFKFEYKIREALFDGAQTGDYAAHFWWDADALPYGGAFGAHRGEIQMELVDGINIMFGNPNDSRVETQPYILVIGRDTVENLRAEAKRHKAKDADGAFQPDAEYNEQAGSGGKVEITSDDGTGKALYVYLYTKVMTEEPVMDENTGEAMQEPVVDKDGNPEFQRDGKGNLILGEDMQPIPKTKDMKRMVTTVHVTKATRTAVIFEDVDTGLSRYPIAWANWEKQKNQYHGRALTTGLIPNQIFINSMFAMAMRHLQLLGFPKTVYNADLIGNWSNEIGQAIGVRGLQPGQSISQVAYNLQPADMSNQILTVIDRAISYTKDCMGATDAQLGNVKPDNTSALMVLQSNAEVPLENIRAGLHEWVEDIGAILLDMMGAYYGERPVVREKELEEPVIGADGNPVIGADGRMETQKVVRRVMELFDFGVFRQLWLRVRVDVGAASQFSEIATTQTLDNLRAAGVLDIVQYLERVPERLIPRKQELIEALKKQESGTTKTGGQGAEQMLGAMSGNTQTRYHALPRAARSALQRQTAMRSR